MLKKLKFIVYKGEIRLARVVLHKHLLPDNYDPNDVQGGGEFEVDSEEKTLLLFGKSYDFGPFDKEAVKACRLPRYFKSYTIIFKEQ